MPEITLPAERRSEHGSPASRRQRRAGRVPAVVYGHGVDPISITVDERELRGALSTEAGANALIDLHIGKERHLALARDLQRHPVRLSVAHVDFIVVRRDEVVSAEVPVVLVGEALGVNRAGGTVEQILLSLRVHAKPADIPRSIEFDVSALEIGDTIRLSAAAIPAGVEFDADPESPVVAGHAPRVEVEEEAAEEAEGERAAEEAEGEERPEGAATESSADDSSGS